MVKRPLVQLFYLGRKLGQGQPLADLRQHPLITLLGSGQIVCCKIIVHDKIPGSYGRQFYKMIPRFTEIVEEIHGAGAVLSISLNIFSPLL